LPVGMRYEGRLLSGDPEAGGRAGSWVLQDGGLGAAVYLGWLAVAELLTTYASPAYGVLCHALLLVCCLLAAAAQDGMRPLWVVACVGPLVRLVSLGAPMWAFPEIYWFVISAGPLFVAGAVAARLLGLSWVRVGLCPPRGRKAWMLEGAVALSGCALGFLEWAILQPQQVVVARSPWGYVASGAVLLICTGLLEEFLFRGLMQTVATEVLGGRSGLLFTAMAFMILHVGYRSLPDLLFVGGVGLYFGAVVRRTSSLLGVTLAHGAINTMLFVVLPMVVGR